jgi:hypothetical protein
MYGEVEIQLLALLILALGHSSAILQLKSILYLLQRADQLFIWCGKFVKIWFSYGQYTHTHTHTQQTMNKYPYVCIIFTCVLLYIMFNKGILIITG